MRALVVNLTRFGDLLQSAAALHALVHDAPAARIGIVCLDNFAAGAELLKDVSDIYPLPAGKFSTALHVATGTAKSDTAWIGGVKELYEWAQKVRTHFSPDRVYNFSPTITSRLLARLLADGKECYGFALDEFGFRQDTSIWATFLQGGALSRLTSPFNIVDMFRKIAVADSPASDSSLLDPPPEAVREMEKELREAMPQETKGFIALQLGASSDIRRWPVPSFAVVADALWEKFRLLPLLLGAKKELPLAEEYASNAGKPHYSLIGKTDITRLAAALNLSSLLISNDTGTLHLASGLHTPVLGIYLATAQVFDTGPHAGGNCSLEPDIPCHPCDFNVRCDKNYLCHSAVTPEAVIELACAKISSGKWAAENFSARVWESARDEHGFTDILSLSGHDKTARTRWMRLERHLYRQFFDKKKKEDLRIMPPGTPLAGCADLDPALDGICAEALALLELLGEQSKMLLKNPLPQIKNRFTLTRQRLGVALASHPALGAISFLWQCESASQTDMGEALQLIQQYQELFRSLLPFLK
ncbi:heptosyltransferase [Deltaproteobacteria bacterium]|nr:heptosyltransferase [Deltaproteobacteria bacterium]